MSGFIYAVECAGHIKIGYSTFPERRLTKISSDSPFQCTLLGYWYGTKDDEAVLHEKFSKLRGMGEWFKDDTSIRAFLFGLDMVVGTRNKKILPEGAHPLTAYRFKAELTMDDIAKAVGVSRPTICRWESGKVKIPPNQFKKIEQLTGISRTALRPDIFGEAA